MEAVALKGGSWLFDEVADADVFTPEKLTEEHRLIAKTTEEFVDLARCCPSSIASNRRTGRSRAQLIKRAGDLGLLGLSAPEQYGGLDLDKASALVVVEKVGAGGVVRHHFRRPIEPVRAAAGPLRDRGAEGRLPAAAHRRRSSSAPTRSASRAPGPTRWPRSTRATKQPDGSWSLTGEKMWISNGGFADLFIVFAKVDGEQFTAFLVERAFPASQHRQGRAQDGPARLVHHAGSSCRTRECRPGTSSARSARGHKVALNTLNYGRFSLGAMCAGGCRGGHRRRRALRRAAASSSASRLRASAPSSTSSAR